jgi:type III secretory pathway component EscR
MKLKQLVEGAESLSILMGLKLPIVAAYKLSLFIKKSNPELEEYNKRRNELLPEYAEQIKDKEGKDTGQFKFKNDEKAKKFSDEINKLLDQDISVEVPEFKISELEGLNIEPKHLVNLDWLIK